MDFSTDEVIELLKNDGYWKLVFDNSEAEKVAEIAKMILEQFKDYTYANRLAALYLAIYELTKRVVNKSEKVNNGD